MLLRYALLDLPVITLCRMLLTQILLFQKASTFNNPFTIYYEYLNNICLKSKFSFTFYFHIEHGNLHEIWQAANKFKHLVHRIDRHIWNTQVKTTYESWSNISYLHYLHTVDLLHFMLSTYCILIDNDTEKKNVTLHIFF